MTILYKQIMKLYVTPCSYNNKVMMSKLTTWCSLVKAVEIVMINLLTNLLIKGKQGFTDVYDKS